ERETPILVTVAKAGQAVFVPAVGARARVLERKVRPRIAVGAVVLAHTAPRALSQIWSPSPPARLAGVSREQAAPLGLSAGVGAAGDLGPGLPDRRRDGRSDRARTFYTKAYLKWIDGTSRRPALRTQRIAEVVQLLETGFKQRPKA